MDLKEVMLESSAGVLVTDAEFKVVWANKFEENYYRKSSDGLVGLDVVECHKEVNREKITAFLEQFKAGEMKEFTKLAHGMIITYSSYFKDNVFGGIVRTRIKTPK